MEDKIRNSLFAKVYLALYPCLIRLIIILTILGVASVLVTGVIGLGLIFGG